MQVKIEPNPDMELDFPQPKFYFGLEVYEIEEDTLGVVYGMRCTTEWEYAL